MKIHSQALTLSICAALATLAIAQPADASTINLLASGTHSFSANTTNTMFSLTELQSVGSGTFMPFVRIQATSMEQGYNTQDTHSTLEDATNGPAEPLIRFSDIVDVNRKINLALDYNETGNGTGPITLENLVLVVSTNANKAGPSGTDPFTILSIPTDPGDVVLYDMLSSTRTDAGHLGEQFNIYMDAIDNLASGNGGSGQADLLVQIDLTGVDLTNILDPNHYLYVYSRFSDTQAGYEEWRLHHPDETLFGNPPSVPEPASLGLLAVGAMGLLLRRRRRA